MSHPIGGAGGVGGGWEAVEAGWVHVGVGSQQPCGVLPAPCSKLGSAVGMTAWRTPQVERPIDHGVDDGIGHAKHEYALGKGLPKLEL